MLCCALRLESAHLLTDILKNTRSGVYYGDEEKCHLLKTFAKNRRTTESDHHWLRQCIKIALSQRKRKFLNSGNPQITNDLIMTKN